ncbi:hypothetical protein H0H92_001130, partial [Tricholoma furcatifolium]
AYRSLALDTRKLQSGRGPLPCDESLIMATPIRFLQLTNRFNNRIHLSLRSDESSTTGSGTGGHLGGENHAKDDGEPQAGWGDGDK